ncbi:MAG: hypothetical protein ACI8PZ_001548 [Myxococcota bacterium]|jgi:hypothetical protein
MRATLLLVPLAVLSACSADCGPASQINGTVYRVFGSFLTVDSRRTDAHATHGSPSNGRADWEFVWASDAGAMTVIIDDQPFDGTGEWDLVECGNFAIRWDGDYIDSNGVTHLFEATGDFVVYEDRIDGIAGWNETWQDGDDTGRFTGRTQLRGQQYLQ